MDKQKILIVDDSDVVLELARDALEEAGYEVFTASNGVEANNYIFSGHKPDLIIFDVMLPFLDGDKKAKLLREKEIGRNIPILLISTKSEEELTRLSAEAGVDGFIHKPFTHAGIVASVREFLRR
jgi:DNA-binding response OmpR family regulator